MPERARVLDPQHRGDAGVDRRDQQQREPGRAEARGERVEPAGAGAAWSCADCRLAQSPRAARDRTRGRRQDAPGADRRPPGGARAARRCRQSAARSATIRSIASAHSASARHQRDAHVAAARD